MDADEVCFTATVLVQYWQYRTRKETMTGLGNKSTRRS